MTTSARPQAAELRELPIFAGLDDVVIDWMTRHGEMVELDTGERLFEEGQPADAMFVLVDGAIQIMANLTGAPILAASYRRGAVTGALPYSRATRFDGWWSVASEPTRALRVAARDFPAMLAASPELGQRLVAVMSDRVREATRNVQSREKMSALGKLAAGLAHELNNPASAVARDAVSLRERLERAPELVAAVIERGVTGDALRAATEMLARHRGRPAATLSPLERSDLEDDWSDCLEERGVEEPWLLAETFVDAGFEADDLDPLTRDLDDSAAAALLSWVGSLLTADRLLGDIAAASERISELVASVKSYSHMDRAVDKEPVELAAGIESTLTMLGHKIRRQSVTVERDDQPGVPRVSGYAGELNQVWTNLLDNALDAVAEGGHIRIAAEREGDWVLVRVADDGPGIPAEDQPKIFDAFFTTKGVGEGTGLGLETVHRIVERHGGQIEFESEPGRTEFQVRLPAHVEPVESAARPAAQPAEPGSVRPLLDLPDAPSPGEES